MSRLISTAGPLLIVELRCHGHGGEISFLSVYYARKAMRTVRKQDRISHAPVLE
jgi:hypothetical protein